MKKISPEMLVFRDYLERRRLKETPHRRLILDTFLTGEGHRSVEDVHKEVRAADPRIGYTTVYRAMRLFSECGLAREIDLADGVYAVRATLQSHPPRPPGVYRMRHVDRIPE